MAFRIYTLSFAEYLMFKSQYTEPKEPKTELANYIRLGGFPATHLQDYSQDEVFTIVKDIYNSTIFSDIVKRNQIRRVYCRIPVTIAGAYTEPVQPFLIEPKLTELLAENEERKKTMHPIERIARFHLEFEGIHPFIDGNDGTVYQTLPWNHRGWHCASGKNGSGNNTHIGVEMCEPSCIKYTGGSTFTCSDKVTARAVAKRTYEAAVELFAMLCQEYSLDPLVDGVILSHAEGHKRGIASNHGDPEHLWKQLGMGYTMDGFRKDVKVAMKEIVVGTQATKFANLSEKEVINKIGALFTADQKKSGILASVSLAQFILESGYGKSKLAQNANNCFGMKKSLSGNKWSGSAWDGEAVFHH